MSKAVRLLKQESKVIGIGIPCVLTMDVDYTRYDGVQVYLMRGDKVHVDLENGIANSGDDFFQIERSEFRSLLLN